MIRNKYQKWMMNFTQVNLKHKIEIIEGEKFFIFENFYEKPNQIFEIFLNVPAKIHKANTENSLNTKKFVDLRHNLKFNQFDNLVNEIENLTEQKICNPNINFVTNITKFFDDSFNDYKNNFWWPHYDEGYTLLIYLNENNLFNIYQPLKKLNYLNYESEHTKPWQPRSNFNLLKQFSLPFNTAILFRADKFLHGMGIEDKTYFNRFRINQAMFFCDRI